MTDLDITLDTNILLRLTTNDDPLQASAAQQLIRDANSIAIPILTLCEFSWTMSRFYKAKVSLIIEAIERFLAADKVTVDRDAAYAGLAMMRAGGDFADGVIAHQGRLLGGVTFVSFDRAAVSILGRDGYQSLDPTTR